MFIFLALLQVLSVNGGPIRASGRSFNSYGNTCTVKHVTHNACEKKKLIRTKASSLKSQSKVICIAIAEW